MTLGMSVEVWEKSESTEHQKEIFRICESSGLVNLPNSRSNGQVGGGVDMLVKYSKFSVTILDNIHVPSDL